MGAARVLICDDHAVVRAGIRLILENQADFAVVGEVADGREAIIQARELRPEIVVIDLSMPGLGGLEAIPHILQAVPGVKVLVLTIHEDEAYFFRALHAGAIGYVLKGASAAELLAALRLVIQGGVALPRTLVKPLLDDYPERVKAGHLMANAQLSHREEDVLRLIADGRSNKEIAETLFLSIRTVERHRTSIMNKLGLHTHAELVGCAVRRGILSEDKAH